MRVKAFYKEWEEKKNVIIEALSQVPIVLCHIVADYARGRDFFEPDLIRTLKPGVTCRFFADALAHCGLKGESRYALCFDDLLVDHDQKALAMIRENKQLYNFNLYDKMHIFVLRDGSIILKLTEGDKKMFTLRKYFKCCSLIEMAPSIPANGLAWIHDGYDLVLINVGHMTRTHATTVLAHKVDAELGIPYASVNPSVTVLVVADSVNKVNICRVKGKPNGEIVVDKRVTIEGQFKMRALLLLRNNGVAIVTSDDRMLFYTFDLDKKTSEYVRGGPNCKKLCQFSYHAAEDIVVAFVNDEKEDVYGRRGSDEDQRKDCNQGFFQIQPLFEGTQILTLCVSKADMKWSDCRVSPDLSYLIENLTLKACRVYRISFKYKPKEQTTAALATLIEESRSV